MGGSMVGIEIAHERLAEKYTKRNQAIVDSIWADNAQGTTIDTSVTALARQYGMSPATAHKFLGKLIESKAISVRYTPASRGRGRVMHMTLRKSAAVARKAVVTSFKDSAPINGASPVQVLASIPEVVETLKTIGDELGTAKSLVDSCRTYLGNIELIKANCASMAAIGITLDEEKLLSDIYDSELACIAQVMPYIGYLENRDK